MHTNTRAVCPLPHAPYHLSNTRIPHVSRFALGVSGSILAHRLHPRRCIPVGPTRSCPYSGHYEGASSGAAAFAATHFADGLDVTLKRAKVRRRPFIGSSPTIITVNGTWTSDFKAVDLWIENKNKNDDIIEEFWYAMTALPMGNSDLTLHPGARYDTNTLFGPNEQS